MSIYEAYTPTLLACWLMDILSGYIVALKRFKRVIESFLDYTLYLPTTDAVKRLRKAYMALYEFRFKTKGSDGLKARGLIEAKSIADLFWVIDRFGDPNEATYRKRENIALCYWERHIENQSDDSYELAKWKTFKRSYL